MQRALRRGLLAGLVLISAASASAQTADEVVEKSIAAIGGREALGKLTSRSTTGKIVVGTPAGDLPGTIEILNQAPNKARTLISLDLSAMGAGMMTAEQRFDGTAGYAMDTMQGNREITGDQLANMKNSDFPTPLLRYKEHGTKIELAPKEKVGDRDAHVLALTPQAGPASRLLVDAVTWLPLRIVQTLELPEVGRVQQMTELSDYRDVDGIKVPFSIRSTSAVQTIAVTVTKIEHNVKVDPAIFARPDAK